MALCLTLKRLGWKGNMDPSICCIFSTSAVASVSDQVQQPRRQLSMGPSGFLLRLIKIRANADLRTWGYS